MNRKIERRRIAVLFSLLLITAPIRAAQVEVSGSIIYPTPPLGISGHPSTTTDFLLDASGEKVAMVFQVPKTGTISKVYVRVGFPVTVSESLNVTLQTVSAVDGDPTGAMYGGSSTGTIASPAQNTGYTVTLGNPASATRGDFAAVVVEFTSWSSGNLRITAGLSNNNIYNLSYADHYTTSWSKSSVAPVVGVEYDDGTYAAINETYPIVSQSGTVSFNSGSTPDEYALTCIMPFDAEFRGVYMLSAVGGDFSIDFHDGVDGSTTTLAVDASQLATTATRQNFFLFPANKTLAAGSTYRVSLRPGGSNISTSYFTVSDVAKMDQMSGGADCYLSTRTNSGSWNNNTTAKPLIYMVLDKLDDGAGGGGGGGGSKSIFFLD